ncbi:GPP34 family phosphoprotein [Kibdelosporangium philippinense]|uniref:GPP34 family phosphoprotein n=1 Tax=Kibdelosporangium philippinense TaxID=211113 RepID=A0ABS8ZIC0_9PSEU|nr:GPP34 family phosphoprotein [Kibdelosporangium philippinense]MCE7007134.1 GPP34 family phosphoprotein [Kibdelosporangium philippinense]
MPGENLGTVSVTGRAPNSASLRLADEFFLVAHNHDADTIVPRLHDTGIELGLAGALLAELVLDRRLEVADGRVIVFDPSPPNDQLAASMLRDIVTEPPHSVRVWLEYLSQDARDKVGSRLHVAGHLAQVRLRKWWGGPAMQYRAVNAEQALIPEVRLHDLLARPHPGLEVTRISMDHKLMQDVTLAALAHSTGLLSALLWYHGPHRARSQLDEMRRALPAPLLELAKQTEAAVGDAVLGRRR